MLSGSCKRCDNSGGVKKRGRLGSSRVKEGGLGRVLYFDLFYNIVSGALYASFYILI